MQPNHTILIVDDEPGILETYQQYLSPQLPPQALHSSRRTRTASGAPPRPTYRLVLEKSGEAAVARVETELSSGTRFAAGFFDMKMPGGIDGLETIRRVRALDPEILCGVVTAYQDRSVDDINEAFRPDHEDEWDYINKPFTQAEIQQKARNLVSSWNRRRAEDRRRRDLEKLISCLSEVKGLREPDLADLMQHVLQQLVEFTDSDAGVLVTTGGGITFSAGVGNAAAPDVAREILSRPAVAEAITRAAGRAEIEGSADLSIVPFVGASGRRVAVLLHGNQPSPDRQKLLRIFAESSSAAIENAELYLQIREINGSLSERVAVQTEDIRASRDALQRKSDELQGMLTALKEAERQLVLNEKLAVVGQLAASVAHEINNPLSYILGNLREIQQLASLLPTFLELTGAGNHPRLLEWADAPQFRELVAEGGQMVTECIDGAKRVAHIVSELKGFGRPDMEAVVAVDLNEIVEKALRMLDNQLRHRTTVARSLVAVPAIQGHAGQLLQVMLNLIGNASQAMKHSSLADNRIDITTAVTESTVLVTVSDNGSGIKSANLKKIFDPFFTTKGPREGTGLGLSICRSIVKHHRGTIRVESVEGNGTQFTVELPRTTRATTAADGSMPASSSEEPGAALDILLVEDDEMVSRSLHRLLRNTHRITFAANGREALEIIGRGGHFDVVLCDLMMPGMSGMDLYREVSRSYSHLKESFLFMTGGVFVEGVREFLESPGIRCLSKPIERSALFSELRALLERRVPGQAA